MRRKGREDVKGRERNREKRKGEGKKREKWEMGEGGKEK